MDLQLYSFLNKVKLCGGGVAVDNDFGAFDANCCFEVCHHCQRLWVGGKYNVCCRCRRRASRAFSLRLPIAAINLTSLPATRRSNDPSCQKTDSKIAIIPVLKNIFRKCYAWQGWLWWILLAFATYRSSGIFSTNNLSTVAKLKPDNTSKTWPWFFKKSCGL